MDKQKPLDLNENLVSLISKEDNIYLFMGLDLYSSNKNKEFNKFFYNLLLKDDLIFLLEKYKSLDELLESKEIPGIFYIKSSLNNKEEIQTKLNILELYVNNNPNLNKFPKNEINLSEENHKVLVDKLLFKLPNNKFNNLDNPNIVSNLRNNDFNSGSKE